MAVGLSRIRRMTPERIGVLCLVDLIQDWDVIEPIARALSEDARFETCVIMTDWLNTVSPGVAARARASGLNLVQRSRRAVLAGAAPDLRGWDAVITASESTAPPHKFAYALTQRANAARLATFTMQHGLENVGLTFGGEVAFASQRILIWGDPSTLPHWVDDSIRARCAGIGRIVTAKAARPLPIALDKPIIAIFENLHWTRYSEGYRRKFLSHLSNVAAARGDCVFLLRPHPAGQWASKNRWATHEFPLNFCVAHPDDPAWRDLAATDVITAAAVVITTPSTIALDAAQHNRPVAVTGYGLDLDIYAPLPILQSEDDWRDFVRHGLAHRTDTRGAAFVARRCVPGDAATKALDAIAAGVKNTGTRWS